MHMHVLSCATASVYYAPVVAFLMPGTGPPTPCLPCSRERAGLQFPRSRTFELRGMGPCGLGLRTWIPAGL